MLKYTHMFVLLLACIAVHAQKKRDGKCPNLKSMDEIDTDKYEGTWYIYRQIPPIATKCVKTTYTFANNGIQESAVLLSDGSTVESKGELQIRQGYWNEHFTSPEVIDLSYKVLCTDYDGYTLLWWCEETIIESKVTSSTMVYILTRDRVPSEDVKKSIAKSLKRYKINEGDLKKMLQDCTN